MEVENWLTEVSEKKGSDLFIMEGVPATMKVDGVLHPVGSEKLSADDTKKIVLDFMTENQRKTFLDKKEINFAIQSDKYGRYRVNAFQQKCFFGAVLRRIDNQIPTFEELKMPAKLAELSLYNRGLFIVAGPTGAGKSSTLAAMVGHINQNTKGHIVTVEDPIEYVHEHRSCIVTQREVGIDTGSFEIALQNALRQAPNVVLIGEIRSRETMSYALAFAETGHYCLATIHANNATQVLDRITSFFDHQMHPQLWMDLSLNLRGIVVQKLVPVKEGKGRVPAVEILINTPLMAETIRKNELHQVREYMTRSKEQGMQTYDECLLELYYAGKISYETALQYAESENDVRLKIKLKQGGTPK